ncbi:MAG: glutamate racemase [Clostridia bacterium]|nr:glutamate racemase [Clostridia bacterium]
MLNNKPIGIFDSGLGGLSVVEKIFIKIPHAKIIYLGDTARVPYGGRTAEELTSFADEITHFLLSKDCEIIVDACNSTSAVALDFLQQKYSNPIIGVIAPGVRAALDTTRNGCIGVIATEATVKSGAHKKAAQELDPGITMISLACPDFVPLVESGEVTGERALSIVKRTLEPLKGTNIDTLILGCTHYPYLSELIKEVVGEDIILVDPAHETTKETARYFLQKVPGENSKIKAEDHEFYVTGNPEHFQRIGEVLMGGKLPLVKKVST